MGENKTETMTAAGRDNDTDDNDGYLEKIEDNGSRDKCVGDGIEKFENGEIKTVKLDDCLLEDEGNGDDDMFKEDDGIGDEVEEYSDGVEPFLEDNKAFPSVVKYRMRSSESEDIIEQPKIKIRRQEEVEKIVSLRIAAAILALSVLIYTAFVIYTEPLRQVIVNIFKDIISFFTNPPCFTELTISEDKLPLTPPKI